jgi:homoserine dehydrogenase
VGAPFGRPVDQLERAERAPMQRHEGGYYIRLTVHDRPGVAAGVATRMAQADISIESILQKRQEKREEAAQDRHGRSGAPVPLVLITYAASEGAIRAALDLIAADGLVAEPPQVIRIERD